MEATSANETTPVRSLVDLRADAIADQIKLCIQAASSSEGAFVAVKVTGMGSTRALKNVSGVAGFARDLFVCHATNEPTTTGTTNETTADAISGTGDANRSLTLDYDGFCGVVRQLPGAAAHPPSDEQLREWFTMASGCARGSIGARVNWSGFSSVISFTRDTTRHLFVGKVAMPVDSRWTARTWSVSNKFMPEVTLRDITEFEKVVERIDRVCQEAQRMRVRLMLDAEQTYFQPAIDMVAMLMMAKYNRSVSAGPLVYNTYQFYLKG